jgi:C-terminal processing protease CtpA/Prc
LSDAEIVLRLKRLTASLGVAHTGVGWLSGARAFRSYPLVEGLKLRPALNAKGHLYALIGRSTFSSGLLAAIDLKREASAILVGESTGGKPKSYGEMRSFKLPHSQLEVTYCTKYFHLMHDTDPPSLNPDLPAAIALTDFLADRDPALETALRHLP